MEVRFDPALRILLDQRETGARMLSRVFGAAELLVRLRQQRMCPWQHQLRADRAQRLHLLTDRLARLGADVAVHLAEAERYPPASEPIRKPVLRRDGEGLLRLAYDRGPVAQERVQHAVVEA